MVMSPDDAVARSRLHQSTFDKAPGHRFEVYFHDIAIIAAGLPQHSMETGLELAQFDDLRKADKQWVVKGVRRYRSATASSYALHGPAFLGSYLFRPRAPDCLQVTFCAHVAVGSEQATATTKKHHVIRC